MFGNKMKHWEYLENSGNIVPSVQSNLDRKLKEQDSTILADNEDVI